MLIFPFFFDFFLFFFGVFLVFRLKLLPLDIKSLILYSYGKQEKP